MAGVDAAKVADRVWFGFGKVAEKVGFQFDQFRAPNATDPLNVANKIGSIKGSIVQPSGNYTAPDSFAGGTWRFYVDGRQTQVFDYFVSTDPILPDSIFYIANQDPIISILAVQCTHVITITRPTQPTGVGSVGYGGYIDSTATVLAALLPVSMIQGNKGEKNPVKLPTDSRMPWFTVLAPDLPGLDIQTGDIITDERDVQYIAGAVELTELGYRLNVHELGA